MKPSSSIRSLVGCVGSEVHKLLLISVGATTYSAVPAHCFDVPPSIVKKTAMRKKMMSCYSYALEGTHMNGEILLKFLLRTYSTEETRGFTFLRWFSLNTCSVGNQNTPSVGQYGGEPIALRWPS